MSTPQPQRPAEAGAHSPLPWEVVTPQHSQALIHIVAGKELPVARVLGANHYVWVKANAALIVTAVNERPALLARLEAAEKLAEAAKDFIAKVDAGRAIADGPLIHALAAALAAWKAITATGGAGESADGR